MRKEGGGRDLVGLEFKHVSIALLHTCLLAFPEADQILVLPVNPEAFPANRLDFSLDTAEAWSTVRTDIAVETEAPEDERGEGWGILRLVPVANTTAVLCYLQFLCWLLHDEGLEQY